MATTTERGLGWKHRQQRDRLLRNHVDGSPCWWCNQPLHRDPTRNWDGRSLHADHSIARSRGGTIADRLIHDTCNKSRGDGSRDHLRPAITGIDPASAKSIDDQLGIRLLPWP
ncbi:MULTISPECIES: hypothetical protein [Rhodococcus]|uniref:hypothetical protein n=1 Tax=unclassified Rhodococcus (in: high G+C Gram-positive bacteria) TaxID=192944 RepID=UPI001EF11D3B|nr:MULTISPECIES: hypothetical protein [Rhodococcus]